MDHYDIMLLLLCIGFLLLGIGFSYREREWGVSLIGFGALVMLAPIALKMYLVLHLPG
ncbi:hypothetical protein [Pseudomonas sp. LRF_L74]|uniref:hypothetical protein n=1 Tax=Pseudomonas sp. LRF_L74 TaxID=3369422 RepID=UPI003F5F722F